MQHLLIWFHVLNGLVINTEKTIAMFFHTRQIKSFFKNQNHIWRYGY